MRLSLGLRGTDRALSHTGSLRRLLVFSWGHHTQRWINWRERSLSHLSVTDPGRTAGTADGFDGCTRNLKPSQNPLYGFWR